MKSYFKKLLTRLGLLDTIYLIQRYFAFGLGAVVYLITKKTPGFGYQAMVYLFCRTNGRFNDQMSNLISFLRPAGPLTTKTGVLGKITPDRLKRITEELNENGYYVFEDQLLGSEICSRLQKLALEAKAVIRDNGVKKEVRYERNQPLAVRYDFPITELVSNPDVQDLIADPTLELVARSYLKTKPVIDIITMWWNTAFSPEPSKEAAQYYHFDMDRFKWVKFFFYLTDVGPEQGPHSFVAGSQKTGAIPQSLLERGYARLNDEDVVKNFPKDKFKEFTAPRGYILAEDTRGLHKGKNVTRDDRLVFQLQYSNSLFGAFFEKHPVPKLKSEALKERLRLDPYLFGTFQL